MKKEYTNIHIRLRLFGNLLFYAILFLTGLYSCSITRQINKQANQIILNDSVISTGHTGISIYEPAADKYWYNYDATKYFVPASNAKLFSLYAGMKYLGDSLTAAKYSITGNDLFIEPMADPTFLHPDFDKQPLIDLIKKNGAAVFVSPVRDIAPYGQGWAWDDYDQGYMIERSAFPVYGNQVWLSPKQISTKNLLKDTITDTAKYFENQWLFIKPKYFSSNISYSKNPSFFRNKNENKFFTDSIKGTETIPFITNNCFTTLEILQNLLDKKFAIGENFLKGNSYKKLKSQPTDSMLAPMMHNSDNFFAEQTLLMASNERLGCMNDEAIIDTLLATDLKGIPQKPTWVDGSGLSRYNLFTPQSLVYILNKMKNEFGLERLKTILPTGNEGTLKNYYVADSSFIFAKTGSLSNHIAFSGFLITRKNKLLIFSVLNNHFIGRATAARRAVEKFLKGIRQKY